MTSGRRLSEIGRGLAREHAHRYPDGAFFIDLHGCTPASAGAAGIFPFGPTHEATETDFDRVYAVNVKAQFFLVAELAPGMAKRGHGAIINVTTMVAEFGMPGMGYMAPARPRWCC